MNADETLGVIAQLALGISGFSGVAIVFTRRPGRLSGLEKYRIVIVLANGFAALFLALLPIVLHGFEVAEATIWRASSAAMVAFSIWFTAYWLPRALALRRTTPSLFSPVAFTVASTGHGLNTVLQILALLRVVEPAAAAYVLGLVWLLFHATQQFARIMFVHPPARRRRPAVQDDMPAEPLA